MGLDGHAPNNARAAETQAYLAGFTIIVTITVNVKLQMRQICLEPLINLLPLFNRCSLSSIKQDPSLHLQVSRPLSKPLRRAPPPPNHASRIHHPHPLHQHPEHHLRPQPEPLARGQLTAPRSDCAEPNDPRMARFPHTASATAVWRRHRLS